MRKALLRRSVALAAAISVLFLFAAGSFRPARAIEPWEVWPRKKPAPEATTAPPKAPAAKAGEKAGEKTSKGITAGKVALGVGIAAAVVGVALALGGGGGGSSSNH